MELKQLNTRKLFSNLALPSLTIINLISFGLCAYQPAQPVVQPMLDSTVPVQNQQSMAPNQPLTPPPVPAQDSLLTAATKFIKRKKDEAVHAISTKTKEYTTAHKRHKDLPSGRVINIVRPDQFYYYLEHTERKMLIVAQFVRRNCRSCYKVSPTFQQIASQNIDVVFLNIDTFNAPALESLAAYFGISRYPTFLCFKAGQRNPLFRMSGLDVTTLNGEINRLR